MFDPKKPRVLVALGGKSSEREVSLSSGREVATALENQGYSVDLIDFGTGKFLQLPELDNIEKDSSKLPKAVNYPLTDIARHFEVVFIAMHGKFGEDGTLQGLLEEIGIKYVGSGRVPSAICMDKRLSKVLMKQIGIPTPDYEILSSPESRTKIPFPVVVKPIDQGSSVGVSICQNGADLDVGKKEAFKYSDKVIVEKCIAHREFTVPVLENEKGQAEALPVIEIIPKQKFFNYQAKYDGSTEEVTPARISKELENRAKEIAVRTHIAHDCKHFSRVDMMMDKNNQLYVIDVNTIPGLTPESLFPKSARAAGMSFEQLCDHLVKISVR
jgi:D-alanine-D-alanine ligase